MDTPAPAESQTTALSETPRTQAVSAWDAPLPPKPLRQRVWAVVIGVLIAAGWIGFSSFALPYAGPQSTLRLMAWPLGILAFATLVLLLIRQARGVALGMGIGLVIAGSVLLLVL